MIFNYNKFKPQIDKEFHYYKDKDRSKYFQYCLDLGDFAIILDYPNIKTDFCFDDSFDYDGAQQMAEHARTSHEYFIRENLAPINKKIKYYEEMLEEITSGPKTSLFYFTTAYNRTFRQMRKFIKYINYDKPLNEWGVPENIPDNAIKATPEDIKKIIEGYYIIKKDFEKRINTYLKRYGTSKVNSWTYWGMA